MSRRYTRRHSGGKGTGVDMATLWGLIGGIAAIINGSVRSKDRSATP